MVFAKKTAKWLQMWENVENKKFKSDIFVILCDFLLTKCGVMLYYICSKVSEVLNYELRNNGKD